MSKLQIPKDRTIKQPSMCCCRNPACVPPGQERFVFQVEHDLPECPKCKCNDRSVVQLLTLIHLLLPSDKGLIPGVGRRYVIACDVGREHLATHTNNEAAIGNVEFVNCVGCLAAYQKVLKGG